MTLHVIAGHVRKIQEIGVGITAYESLNALYDFLFYPLALSYWGLTVGGIVVTTGALLINGFVFWLYEYMRIDWLGAHALRELEKEENRSSIARLMTWVGKKKQKWWEKILNPIVFIALLLPIDPVIVAIHYQREHFKGKLVWEDWGILLLATLVANLWWILKVELVIQALLYLFHLVF